MSFARIGGITLRYRLEGNCSGRPLVLVNSLGTDARIWDDVIEALRSDFLILSYDKRGHGLSDVPAGPCDIDDDVADLIGLADHCGLDRFGLCGVSIGGMIGLRAAAMHGPRVSRLVLSNTAAAIGTPASWDERMAAVRTGGMTAVSATVLSRWFSPGFRDAHPAEYDGWRNLLERSPVEGYVASCATVRNTNLSADLPRISASTLVIAGEHDQTTPPDLVRALCKAIGRARFELIEGVGHIPSIERPEIVSALLRNHFSEDKNG